MSTHNIPFLDVKKKIILNHPKSATMGFVPRDQEQVRNSRGNRAISVRAIEVPLYIYFVFICKNGIKSGSFRYILNSSNSWNGISIL